MSDLQSRLIRCFQAVFPQLTESEVVRSSASRTVAWDSVATVTLAAVVEEEFGMQFHPEDFEKLISFQTYLTALEGNGYEQ